MVRADDEQTGIGLVLNPESINFEIELLASRHDKAAFSCGNDRLHILQSQHQLRPFIFCDMMYVLNTFSL